MLQKQESLKYIIFFFLSFTLLQILTPILSALLVGLLTVVVLALFESNKFSSFGQTSRQVGSRAGGQAVRETDSKTDR